MKTPKKLNDTADCLESCTKYSNIDMKQMFETGKSLCQHHIKLKPTNVIQNDDDTYNETIYELCLEDSLIESPKFAMSVYG